MSNNKGEWSLDLLYTGIEAAEYQQDKAKLLELLEQLADFAAVPKDKAYIVAFLLKAEQMGELALKIFAYLQLRLAVNTTDAGCMNEMAELELKAAMAEKYTVEWNEAIIKYPDFAELLALPEFKEYQFMLQKLKDSGKYLLPVAQEALIARLKISGGSAWSQLFSVLTSKLKATYKDEQLTLPQVRNLAHDPDASVRQAAYEAELKSYSQIEDSLSFALNSIKKEVSFLAAERGYDSPLHQALEHSCMKQETLTALLTAMKANLSVFWRYLSSKAKMLGHTGALPWWDLFAPLGKISKKFDLDSARAYLTSCFAKLSPDVAELIERAFAEEWIDFFPRAGKVGGAFCYNLAPIKQSRILSNFDGSFDAVDTLAHELGHAFHGSMIEDHRALNLSYSMPVAETASTFNEMHLCLCALEEASSKEEEIALLETILMNATQTICDIYSRYLFETEVFARCATEFLDTNTLQDIMLRAQKEAYGSGLDQEHLHPYMWANKGHYYSNNLSFYNFPYAFGSLFSMGLYKLYQVEGAPFMERYKHFLHETTVSSVEDAAAILGVDLSKLEFWQGSLSVFAELVERFAALA